MRLLHLFPYKWLQHVSKDKGYPKMINMKVSFEKNELHFLALFVQKPVKHHDLNLTGLLDVNGKFYQTILYHLTV